MFLDGTCDLGPPPSQSRVAAVSFGRDLSFQAAHVCNHLVSSSFHPPSGALFNFPSPYLYAIGLETYLVLEVGGSQFPAPKPGYSTQGLRLNSTRLTPTGLSPSPAGRFRPLRLRQDGGSQAHNTTSPTSFPAGFSLDSSRFARRYSGNPDWFLFLPLLGCFRSEGSRSKHGASRRPCDLRDGKSYSGILGSKATCAYPRLIAACRALLQRSSQAILQTAWHVELNRSSICLTLGLCMVFIVRVLCPPTSPFPPHHQR